MPFNGNVSTRLLEKYYKGKSFYYVGSKNSKRQEFELRECRLTDGNYETPLWKFDSGKEFEYGMFVPWEDIFDVWEDAKKEIDRRNVLYRKGFYQIPFVKLEVLEKYKEEMLRIENTIKKYLKGFENFQGIDFCDVNARGIQIRGHHKEIKNYTYGRQPTIKYDFSNADDVIWEFLKMWGEVDNPQAIAREKAFIADGEKYGWD